MNFTWKVWVSSTAEFPRLRSIGSATQTSFSDPAQGFELFACCCWKAAVVLIVWPKWRRINHKCRWLTSTKSENVLTASAPAVFRLCSRQPVRNCQVRIELVGPLASPFLLPMSTYMRYWLPGEQLLEERMSGPKRVWKAPSSPGCVIFSKKQSSFLGSWDRSPEVTEQGSSSISSVTLCTDHVWLWLFHPFSKVKNRVLYLRLLNCR